MCCHTMMEEMKGVDRLTMQKFDAVCINDGAGDTITTETKAEMSAAHHDTDA